MSLQTDIKDIYRRNRRKHKHIQNTDINDTTAYYNIDHVSFDPLVNTDTNKPINDINDDTLVILAKQTTLTEAQKNVLKKGLKFIPKPKQLPIQALHLDIRNFAHRLKVVHKLKTTTTQYKQNKEPGDPFTHKQSPTYNLERLTDNGSLDTFLHRVRLEMLDTDKYKQNKQDNLTRKERIALRQLIENQHIVK